MRMEKKNYPQVYLEECKYKMKRAKMTKFMEAELESESESELESEIELELKSETEGCLLTLNEYKSWYSFC